MRHNRPGPPATVAFDASPGMKLRGHVESIAPATGVLSANVAVPENATGNFTKLMQRLAVRIEIDPTQTYYRLLRVGISATPSIGIAGR